MNFNILRVQFTNSIRTVGIRRFPLFQNKSILIIRKPFVTTSTKLNPSLSNKNHTEKSFLYKREYNTTSTVNTTPSRRSNTGSKSIVEKKKAREWSEMTIGQKVAGAAKVTTNISVIAIGIGIFGVVIYFIIKELFSSSGSSRVFNETLEKIRSNSECQKILGMPIKGHGAPSSRRRRRNRLIRFQEVINTDGTPHKFMQIYLYGPITHGIALLDMIKNDKGIWVIKYLVVTIPEYGKKIFVEYNEDVNKMIDESENK
ncbi:14545_t:CDS:2 [Funneliformis geosporum]|uniref:Mitochondrial import inner membrane translocase subunit Tim21 n=1 Tax=Funneliformis geosporum TaxID=1117311 RepID=A0A9W4X4G8_9GLOM|nr:7931_t:CDS:2 [Funneliformis geosporum]CAI2186081.1 14545_t:CDS:2 [Funneliformis geosporum]